MRAGSNSTAGSAMATAMGSLAGGVAVEDGAASSAAKEVRAMAVAGGTGMELNRRR